MVTDNQSGHFNMTLQTSPCRKVQSIELYCEGFEATHGNSSTDPPHITVLQKPTAPRSHRSIYCCSWHLLSPTCPTVLLLPEPHHSNSYRCVMYLHLAWPGVLTIWSLVSSRGTTRRQSFFISSEDHEIPPRNPCGFAPRSQRGFFDIFCSRVKPPFSARFRVSREGNKRSIVVGSAIRTEGA
jgi:hypothetical protein